MTFDMTDDIIGNDNRNVLKEEDNNNNTRTYAAFVNANTLEIKQFCV